MQKVFILALVVLVFSSCLSDKMQEHQLIGKYRVTLNSPEAKQEMEKARKNLKKDIEKAQEDTRKSVENAKKEIAEKFKEDSNFGEAMQHFVDGMGKLAEGVVSLGEEVGNLGLDLGDGFLKGLKLKLEFKEDGQAIFGSKNFGEDLRWEIKDGRLYMWNLDEVDKTEFTLKKLSADEWELINDEVILQLSRMKDKK
ncbi:MAG: hypothetical protein ACE5FF_10845 [Saprospiraceae bacterium]